MNSQNDEERVILEALGDAPPGYLMDLGAGDGKLFSNTRALMERGWSGMLIEADFESFGKLFELYKGNDKATLINAAIDPRDSVIEFWKAKPEEQGLCSTATERNREIWKDHLAGKYYVGTITPDQIRNQFGVAPAMINVDLEGNSFDIFMMFQTWVPTMKVACIEHDGRAVEIGEWGNKVGLRTAYLNAENIILVRK